MIGALLLGALASTGDARARLEDALLARALGEHARCRSRLLTLVNELAADDPVRGEALSWLATVEREQGEQDRAREHLRDCIRSGPARSRCEEQLAALELEARAVRERPTVWDFDGPHGLVLSGRGRILVKDGRLHWFSVRDPSNPSALSFGLDLADDEPLQVEIELFSPESPAWLNLLVVDRAGTVRPAPEGIQRVPTGELHNLRFTVERPASTDRAVLRDMSGLSAGSGSESHIELHAISFR